MKVTIVAAVGDGNFVIGSDGKLPWKLPEDLRRFKVLTAGHPIIMGRKTFDSIGEPLKHRFNVVVTGSSETAKRLLKEGCDAVARSVEEAIRKAELWAEGSERDEIFVIGGESIYRQAMPYTDCLRITFVDGKFEGDTFFPTDTGVDWRSWPETQIPPIEVEAGNGNSHKFTIRIFEKKG